MTTASVVDTPSPVLPPRPRYSWAETKRLIKADIGHRCQYENKPQRLLTGIKMLRHPGVACVVRYRLQCFFYDNRMGLFGALMRFINLAFYGVSIDRRVQIGGGFLMGHAITMMIHGDVVIGERCVIFHQNTIASSPYFEPDRASGPLIIGDDVVFGGGACAYGNITIGDRCRVGANSVVDRSFPADSALFGVPARIVSSRARETS